jgi:hypothetical protein
MRGFLTVSIIIAVTLPILAQRGGNPGALGQEVRRPAAPSGPTPRLPDGTVDLNGLWIGGAAVGDMERDGGLKPGEVPILPWAKALRDSRKEPDDPYLYCMPQGVVRGLSNPGDELMEYICQENNQYGIAGGHVNQFTQPEK